VIKCACECLPEILLFFPFENDFFQRVLKKNDPSFEEYEKNFL